MGYLDDLIMGMVKVRVRCARGRMRRKDGDGGEKRGLNR